ncbi:MAG: hypothetical protein H6Q14_363 [Bacteroidetes bacterium]|nr:hypothetical protein [Bacteroidota bacterium]
MLFNLLSSISFFTPKPGSQNAFTPTVPLLFSPQIFAFVLANGMDPFFCERS